MLLFIEGYPYNLNDIVKDDLTVRDVLKDVVSFPSKDDKCSFMYVGYCYSKAANDVIFFLPKVVLTGEANVESGDDTIFGASPQEIIDFESDTVKDKFKEEGYKKYKEFLSSLSIWIYRTISVYRKTNNDNILESKEYQSGNGGRKHKYNTLLDVIIALRDFNRDNQDYFTFIAKNIHSGYNKIDWHKTVSSSQAFIQGNVPVYINPVNRKKMVNFDEELLIIYYSILNYIHETHGFKFEINIQYKLISYSKFKSLYIEKKFGCRRLKQIKYKYFSDKALRIWDLCYAFFDREYKIAMNRQSEDYLLAKDFDHIFEVMIDTLICGDAKKTLPRELVEQKDGKLVDHMFIDQGLIEQSDLPSELTYYIGDSKYYKRSKNDRVLLGDNSIYKQYTYARNVIQWNLNLFLDGDKKSDDQPQLRDTLTEGYNLIPNFFISAKIPGRQIGDSSFLSFNDGKLNTQDVIQLNRQFENRLFDRDTLLLCHYDVNFLYIVALYGRDNKSSQIAWRDYVRKEFRSKIQETLNQLYSFRILQPREGMDCYQFIHDNFQRLNGKLYRPKTKSNYLVLAVMKEENSDLWKSLNVKEATIKHEMEDSANLIDSLKTHFHVSEPFTLEREFNVDPVDHVGTLDKLSNQNNAVENNKNGVLLVMMEKYESRSKYFNGKIAVGLKSTLDSVEIIKNLDSIGYVLFHHRSDLGLRLFPVNSVKVVESKDVDDDIYRNVKEASLYVVVDFNQNSDCSVQNIVVSDVKFDLTTRYDAQYVDIHDLMLSDSSK